MNMSRNMSLRYLSFFFVLCLWPLSGAVLASDCSKAKEAYDRGVKLMNFEDRAAAFREAIRLCPSYAEAHVNLADSLENMGRLGGQYGEQTETRKNKFLDMAAEHYRRAIELNPQLFPAHLGLAEVYADIGLYERAKDACKNALRLQPHDETTEKLLANIEKRLAEQPLGLAKAGEITTKLKNSRLDQDFSVMGPEGYTVKDRQGFNNILFEGWSARISPGEPTDQLNEIGAALSSPDVSAFRFVVEGHTNTVGGYDENEKLSWERAKSVKQYLVSKYKIDSNRLLTQGLGYRRLKYEDRPKDEKNRRVEILFLKRHESE